MNPIERIISDRQIAQSQGDDNADICFLALASNNTPSVRTLVLREISHEGFTLFINKTSKKWEIMSSNPAAEMLIWYSSTQRQYRVSGTIDELDRGAIEKNWFRRPVGSKYLDHTYEKFARQSSEIDSREKLLTHIDLLRKGLSEDDMTTPENATGIILRPSVIECLDLNQKDRIHDRRKFTLLNNHWQETLLMP